MSCVSLWSCTHNQAHAATGCSCSCWFSAIAVATAGFASLYRNVLHPIFHLHFSSVGSTLPALSDLLLFLLPHFCSISPISFPLCAFLKSTCIKILTLHLLPLSCAWSIPRLNLSLGSHLHLFSEDSQSQTCVVFFSLNFTCTMQVATGYIYQNCIMSSFITTQPEYLIFLRWDIFFIPSLN